MGKNKEVKPIKINFGIDAPEALKGEVKNFGTGGAHIIFNKNYVGYEVLVIPLKKIKNENDKKLGKNK